MTVWSADSAVSCWFSIRSWTLDTQRRVVDDLEVALEDVGRRVTQFLGDLLDEGLQIGRRVRHGPVEPLHLARHLAGLLERLGADRAEDRLDPIGDPDHHARTDPDSFTHDNPVSRDDHGRTSRATRPPQPRTRRRPARAPGIAIRVAREVAPPSATRDAGWPRKSGPADVVGTENRRRNRVGIGSGTSWEQKPYPARRIDALPGSRQRPSGHRL